MPISQDAPEQESAQSAQNSLSFENDSADFSAVQAAAAASEDGRRGDGVNAVEE